MYDLTDLLFLCFLGGLVGSLITWTLIIVRRA